MQIKVLGCSGGIGGELRTTALRVDHDILIDAGTGVGDLSIDELLAIDHIFVTHSHLDHIGFIPLLLDTVQGLRTKPVTVYANDETILALRTHIFNWVIWPDFNKIPSDIQPILRYTAIKLGETITLDGRKITALPVNHIVPAMGFHINSGKTSLVFTGDTTTCDALWMEVNKIENLKYIIIETAFSNSEHALAIVSKHLCPIMLQAELAKLKCHPITHQLSVEVFITHLKPGEGEIIMQEIAMSDIKPLPQALRNHQVFNL